MGVKRDVIVPLSLTYHARSVTLNQLKVFVLVVRLGSLRAAANALGVSEPAVSQAITALRQSLGDQLITRNAAGIELTVAGQRIVGLASQMVNLAAEAEAAVRHAQGGLELLRVLSSATPGESVVPALLQAFMSRAGRVEATLGIGATNEMSALLQERLADVAIGPRLAGPHALGVVSEPLMRYRLSVVARAGHPLAATAGVPLRRLADADWLVDSSATDPESDSGRLLRHIGVAESRLSICANQQAAWAAAASGHGVAFAVEHLFALEPRGDLVVLPIGGTPVESLWYVNMLSADRRPSAASQLHRFLSTPDAMHAMVRADGRVPASRFKPPVYVTIWS